MGKSKNTLTLSLMTCSIILVLVLQGFWLKSAYKEASERFSKETGFLFRTTVMSLQDSLLRGNIEVVSPDSLFDSSLLPAGGPPPDSLSMLFSRSVFKTNPDSAHVAIMITSDPPNHNSAFSRFHKDRPARYFVLRDTDSLRVRDIQGEYQAALTEADIRIPFHISKLPPDTNLKGAGGRFPAFKGKFSQDGAQALYLGMNEVRRVDIREKDKVRPALPGVDHLRAVDHIKEESGRSSFSQEKRLMPFPGDGGPEAEHVFLPQTGFLSVKFDSSAYHWYLLNELTPQLLFSLVMVLFIGISFYFMYRSLRMQQRLMLLKNDFVSNMTHELKTPVATASVAIEALRRFQTLKQPERTLEYLEIAQHELNRLSLLTDNILKAAIFESKGIAIQVEFIEVKELICQVLASMKLVFEKKRAEVSFHAEGENFQARGGKAHIVNVIYNLLDNALKYSTGKPQIIIRLKSLKDGILLNVKDNGTGIPPEFHQKVFEKFFRVPSGDVHNVKGHGLGLSYVSGVVKSHGGTIRLDSQPGRGSLFTVYLPRNYEKNQGTLHRR